MKLRCPTCNARARVVVGARGYCHGCAADMRAYLSTSKAPNIIGAVVSGATLQKKTGLQSGALAPSDS